MGRTSSPSRDDYKGLRGRDEVGDVRIATEDPVVWGRTNWLDFGDRFGDCK